MSEKGNAYCSVTKDRTRCRSLYKIPHNLETLYKIYLANAVILVLGRYGFVLNPLLKELSSSICRLPSLCYLQKMSYLDKRKLLVSDNMPHPVSLTLTDFTSIFAHMV